MQMIKVKYTGKGDAIFAEHDGIKYAFYKEKPVQIIPLIVFQAMQNQYNVFRDEVIPVQDATEEKKEETKKTIEQEVDEIEKDIEPLKEKEDESKASSRTRRPSRSRKGRSRSL